MPHATLKGALASFAASLLQSGTPASPAQGGLDTRKWSAELLKRLEWRRLEELGAAYFEALGFATRVSCSGAERGADISLSAPGAGRASILVQCKAWNAHGIGVKPLLVLRGLMEAGGFAQGMMLSAGRFTQEAKAFAAAQAIELIDGAALLARLDALPPEQALALLRFATEGDFVTPTCPACSIKMVSRRSTQGGRKFWGCPNYPRCKYISYPSVNAPA